MILYAPKSDQKAEIVIPDNVKKIAVKVSGGADSAFLLYVLVKHVKESGRDLEILPIHNFYFECPAIAPMYAVVNKVRSMFNYEVPFLLEPYVWYRGKLDEYIEDWHDVKFLELGKADMLFSGRTAAPKLDAHDEFYEKCRNNYGYVEGRFAWGENDFPTRERIFTKSFRLWGQEFPEDFPERYIDTPFINVDKRFIAEMYDLYGIRDEIFPLTWSCVANFPITKGYTEPCGKCFWCLEKEWAFGETDTPHENLVEEIGEYVYSNFEHPFGWFIDKF